MKHIKYFSHFVYDHVRVYLMWVGFDAGGIRDEKYLFFELVPYNTSGEISLSLSAIFNRRSLPYISSLKLIMPSLSTQAVQ